MKSLRESIFQFGVYERDRWIAAQAAVLPPGSRVLDVGAGPCRHRPLFAHCEYKSQDFCLHQPTRQGNTVENWSYGAVDYVCDATSIPVADASFDAVLCTEMLEHVPEPALVVRELARILRPGGTLILTAPLTSGLHQEPDHFYGGFTPFWYDRFLSTAGFDQIEGRPNGGFFKHYGQESQRFSTLIDPRNLSGSAKALLAPVWIATWPLFRVVLPVACRALDQVDTHQGFTVGYHVKARRGAAR